MNSNGKCRLILPGFKFKPTEDTFVHYLTNTTELFSLGFVHSDVQIYKESPPDLAAKHAPVYKHAAVKEWYYYFKRERLCGNRTSRTAGEGYWKATSGDVKIKKKGSDSIIGYKKSLVYYYGTPKKGTKTNWLMKEYKIDDKKLDDPVLCLIYENVKNKSDDKDDEINNDCKLKQQEEAIYMENNVLIEHAQYEEAIYNNLDESHLAAGSMGVASDLQLNNDYDYEGILILSTEGPEEGPVSRETRIWNPQYLLQ